MEDMSLHETESGYVSGSGSESSLPEIHFTKPHLAFLNRQLQFLEPQGTSHLFNSLRSILLMVHQIYYDGALPHFLAFFKQLLSVLPVL